MALAINLNQKQILSQRMIQSTAILQMGAADLEDYLSKQSLENPVIDLVSRQPSEDSSKKLEKYQWICSHDEQNRYLYHRVENPAADSDQWNQDLSSGETLQDVLWEQVLTLRLSPEYEDALKKMICCLNENGYFTDSLDEFCSCFGVSRRTASMLLTLIQRLEPAGVGARSLQECLCLQLQRRKLLTPVLQRFICEYLEKFAKNQLPAIARGLSISLEEVKRYGELIRTLNPRPGASCSTYRCTSYIQPDVTVTPCGGQLTVVLNEARYPDVQINTDYLRMYKSNPDKEVQGYLLQKINQAEWIQQCIQQRNITLLSVVKSIAAFQSDFFFKGSSHLKPLRLTDIAAELDVHESTVSRAIHQKYLQCPSGVYPLHYFFARSAPAGSASSIFRSAGGLQNQATALDVRTALKQIIAEENKKKPLSDRMLAEELETRGFSVSRRTVAKYRDEEGIPGASGRKEY